MATRSAKIDQKADLIWAIADKLTGVYKPHEYGDVILPLTVIRRFDCILSDTKDAVLQKYDEVKNLPMKDILLRKASKKDFYNTSKYTFERLMDDPDHIEENFREYLNKFSANVRDILEKFKFDGHITTMANKGILYIVLKEYTTDRGNLHPNEISNLEMGYIFEEIIRRFSESHNEDAGQHYTPREVIQLMVNILFYDDNDILSGNNVAKTIYDPACGTGGMLSVAEEYLHSLNASTELVSFGQEINDQTFAICKLMQNPIGMLNALQKVSDKIVLFCEAGQIKVPTKPTALSILLEKMVVEVALPKDRQLGRYPSFHPKTWVLAYVNADGDKKYRFVVMSRNLTFDRSWDISFAMDSSKNVRQKKKTQPICDFLDYLVMNVHNTSNNAGKKRNLIRGLCADIKDVSFSLDSKIFGEDFEVLPLGIGKNAYRMQEDILFCKERGNANSTFNELVVMSPFLSESVIADFNLTDRALSDCKRTLVTRRSELGKLKASDVDNFTIYALKDEIIDGEEEISDELADKKKQDIHAKIYLRRKYSDVDLYLGSMNASYSAINKNVEMMLWLGTKNMYLNGDKFLEDIFCGPVGDAKNPFEQVTVADAVLETESDNRNLLEQKIKDLCRVKRQAVISEDNENAGKYKIEVEFSGIESDSEVTVSPFNSKQEQTLSEHIEFSELEILQLSEFYEITARSGDDTIRRIIMIPTSGFPDDRESAAVNSVVKDRASFVEYIAFVLGDDYVASMLEGKQMGESGFFANSSDAMPALYEKMLKTSVEGPERIKDIGYVLKMVTDKDIIPDEFRELYETFCNTLKIRR